MRVMTLGGLGAPRARANRSNPGNTLLLIAPLMTIGVITALMYLHRRSFAR